MALFRSAVQKAWKHRRLTQCVGRSSALRWGKHLSIVPSLLRMVTGNKNPWCQESQWLRKDGDSEVHMNLKTQDIFSHL